MGISKEYLTKIKDVREHGTNFDCFVEVCKKWLKDRAKPKAGSKTLDMIIINKNIIIRIIIIIIILSLFIL